MFDKLGWSEFFSKLELKTGIYEIKIAVGNIENKVYKTKCSHFDFLDRSIGLQLTSGTFRALLNAILRDCTDECLDSDLDHRLIFSKYL